MKYHHSALSFDVQHARSVLAVDRAVERLGADLQKGAIAATGVTDARATLEAVMEESTRVDRAAISDQEAQKAQNTLAQLYLDVGVQLSLILYFFEYSTGKHTLSKCSEITTLAYSTLSKSVPIVLYMIYSYYTRSSTCVLCEL